MVLYNHELLCRIITITLDIAEYDGTPISGNTAMLALSVCSTFWHATATLLQCLYIYILLLLLFYFFTMYAVPSGTPTNVQGIAISSTSIRLTWEPPRPADQNGVIQAYNITITEVVTGRMMYFRQGGMNFLFTVNSLHPYYTYQCSIAAETIGLGPAANISVTTHQGGIANFSQH